MQGKPPTVELPTIFPVVAYPNPPEQFLRNFYSQVEDGAIDIVIIQTLMSGSVPTKGNYPTSEFALNCAGVVPTFFIPQDSKAHGRIPLFYALDSRQFGVVPLDKAYTCIIDEVCNRMYDIWNENKDPSHLIMQMRKEYQMPKEDRDKYCLE